MDKILDILLRRIEELEEMERTTEDPSDLELLRAKRKEVQYIVELIKVVV